MSLINHRKAIDKLDAQIVKLLNERARHSREIGIIKRRAGGEFYEPTRELAVLKRISKLNQLNPDPLPEESLRAIYREVMSGSLLLQKALTVAYLGPEATFTHQAAMRRFGTAMFYSSQKTIADVFSEVSCNRAEYGVVPVENSTEGVVTHTLDMFMDSELKIVAQIVMPIQHCLVGKVKRSQIKKLFVHLQTLAQCRNWLREHFPRAELIETSSNARSAQLAAVTRDAAAISGSLAADKYGLGVLEYDIQDNAENVTRFLVLGRRCGRPTGHDRTSLMFSVMHRAGALYSALSPLRRYRINMTKIESRPSRRKAWEYYFFVDIDGHVEDRRVARALQHLAEHCTFVKVLGSYPVSE